MKIISLFSDFRPRLKCGEVLSTVTGVLGQTYQAKASQENVNHQLSVQQSENQLNRDWQTMEAEKARQFEAEQVQQQNQFQQGLQSTQQQYNLQSMKQQSQYNSPLYMSQQLRQANLNPQVYFGNHASFSGSSAVSGGAPSAPSPAKGAMPGSVQGISPVGFQPSSINPYELMTGVGNLLEGLANAKKAGVETSFLENTLEARIQKAITEGNLAKQQELLSDLDVAFKRANFGTALNTAFAEYKKVLSEIDLNSEKRLTEQEEQKLKKATADMNRSIQALNDKEKERLGITIQFLPRLLESEILSNRGSAAAGFGKAEESHATAEQQRLFNKIYSDKRYQHSIISQAVTAGQQAIDANKLTKQQVDHMNYMIEQAAYSNDMKEFTYWSNQIQGYVHSIGEAASAFYGAGALRELIKLRKAGVPSAPLESGKGYYLNGDGLLFKRP